MLHSLTIELTSAVVGHETEASSPVKCICLIDQSGSWHQKACPCEGNLGIEVVVRNKHPVFCVLTTQIGRPLLGARKALVGGTERCLPYLAEFIQNVGDFSLVGVVVHEYDCSFSHQNHFRQCRPGGNIHWNLGRHICVVGKSGIYNWCTIIANADKIGIT